MIVYYLYENRVWRCVDTSVENFKRHHSSLPVIPISCIKRLGIENNDVGSFDGKWFMGSVKLSDLNIK